MATNVTFWLAVYAPVVSLNKALNRTEEFSDDGAVQLARYEKLPDTKLYQMPPAQFTDPFCNDDQVPAGVLLNRTCKSTVPFVALVDAKVTS